MSRPRFRARRGRCHDHREGNGECDAFPGGQRVDGSYILSGSRKLKSFCLHLGASSPRYSWRVPTSLSSSHYTPGEFIFTSCTSFLLLAANIFFFLLLVVSLRRQYHNESDFRPPETALDRPRQFEVEAFAL